MGSPENACIFGVESPPEELKVCNRNVCVNEPNDTVGEGFTPSRGVKVCNRDVCDILWGYIRFFYVLTAHASNRRARAGINPAPTKATVIYCRLATKSYCNCQPDLRRSYRRGGVYPLPKSKSLQS